MYRPNDNSANMYPYSPQLSNSDGIAVTSGLGSRQNLVVNAIHNDYGSGSIASTVGTSRFFSFVTLPVRDTSAGISSPLKGFTAKSTWAHTGSSICNSLCSGRFTRICPDAYFNATVPQNFGWRYGVNNELEFHQAIDVSRSKGTAVYNVFNKTVKTTMAGDYVGCGNTECSCLILSQSCTQRTCILTALL